MLIGWVFFRANTLPDAYHFLQKMFGVNTIGEVIPIDFEPNFYVFLALGVALSIITLWSFGKKLENFLFYAQYSIKQHVLMSIGALLFFVLSVRYIATSGFNPFIYFRF